MLRTNRHGSQGMGVLGRYLDRDGNCDRVDWVHNGWCEDTPSRVSYHAASYISYMGVV